MIDAGMIEKALGIFFASSEFQVVESSRIAELVRPAISWQVSGGVFETNENGIRFEKLKVICLAVDKNIASEAVRRRAAHKLANKVITKLDGISIKLESGEQTSLFQAESWQDVTAEIDIESKLMVVQAEFSVSMPAQPETKHTEESGLSLKESIRVAVKQLIESPSFGYRALPTLAGWEFQDKAETLAKVFWSGASEAVGRQANSFLRRRDTLNIVVAVPNTSENWQDKTSLTEETFNYSKINQAAIKKLMPKTREQLLGDIDIQRISVEYPALPEAYAVSKISLTVQYAIMQRG